jgi:hypothetical protein
MLEQAVDGPIVQGVTEPSPTYISGISRWLVLSSLPQHATSQPGAQPAPQRRHGYYRLTAQRPELCMVLLIGCQCIRVCTSDTQDSEITEFVRSLQLNRSTC